MDPHGNMAALQVTYHGVIENMMDALIILQASCDGVLSHLPRRPHDRERSALIRSGSIFVYESNASGIARWTDGVQWSPSRILGNFLVYREMEQGFPPGEGRRALKRKRTEDGAPGSQDKGSLSPPSSNMDSTGGIPADIARKYVGSLVDSYGFKNDGLVKKTLSVKVNSVTHHIVSYYKLDDVVGRRLQRPSLDRQFQAWQIRPEFTAQKFRAPIDEDGELTTMALQHSLQRSASVPQLHNQYRSYQYSVPYSSMSGSQPLYTAGPATSNAPSSYTTATHYTTPLPTAGPSSMPATTSAPLPQATSVYATASHQNPYGSGYPNHRPRLQSLPENKVPTYNVNVAQQPQSAIEPAYGSQHYANNGYYSQGYSQTSGHVGVQNYAVDGNAQVSQSSYNNGVDGINTQLRYPSKQVKVESSYPAAGDSVGQQPYSTNGTYQGGAQSYAPAAYESGAYPRPTQPHLPHGQTQAAQPVQLPIHSSSYNSSIQQPRSSVSTAYQPLPAPHSDLGASYGMNGGNYAYQTNGVDATIASGYNYPLATGGATSGPDAGLDNPHQPWSMVAETGLVNNGAI